MIARRAALLLPGAALARPARAQPRRPRRIAVLHSVSTSLAVNAIRILREGWERAGFVAARDVVLRAPEGRAIGLPALVAELLAQDPGVIIAIGAPAVLAAARHGGGVPVLAVDLETDPVEAGLVASEARPGGLVTGLFLHQPSMAARWLDLLLEAAPRTRHVLFLWEPSTGPHQHRAAEAQAASRGLATTTLNPFAIRDHAAALTAFDRGGTGVVMLTAPGYGTILRPLSGALRDAGLPAITFLSNLVGHGLLMGYGPDQDHYYGRVIPLAERILGGEPPGAIPLERPTRFRFVVDLRVADRLGLALPPALLAQADEVIE